MNYYNEIDPKAAAWLRELIRVGAIAPGVVDERSITDVRSGDLAGFAQCHFFAGIGGWSYALRLAGWPDDRPVWSGSCPCQPFSSAGKQRGTADERHLWPIFRELIAKCAPSIVFGEQVASRLGRDWLAAVRSDLEAVGYAVGGADLCAAGVGAPHIRQRLYWVADALRESSERRAGGVSGTEEAIRCARRIDGDLANRSCDGVEVGELADCDGSRCRARRPGKKSDGRDAARIEPSGFRHANKLADTNRRGCGVGGRPVFGIHEGSYAHKLNVWLNCEWIECRDGKHRPVEPGTFPLAHGIPARVGRLRGYGNAIVPQVAAAFILAAESSLNL